MDGRALTRVVLTVVGMALSHTCLAQISVKGLYIGALGGQSKVKDTGCNDFGLSCNVGDTAWKIFVGYQFHPNFAVEAGYIDMGEIHGTGVSDSGVALSLTSKQKAWDVVAVGSIPFSEQLFAFGKLGAYYGKIDQSATGSVPGFTASATASDTNTNVTYGVGGGLNFTQHLTLRAEWQRYNKMGGDNTGKSDVDVIGLSLLFRFH